MCFFVLDNFRIDPFIGFLGFEISCCLEQQLDICLSKQDNLRPCSFFLVTSPFWFTLFLCKQSFLFKNITWSWVAGMKFCPVLPGSWQCHKLFMNYILRLHLKFSSRQGRIPILYCRDSSLVGQSFPTVSARLSRMKKQFNPWL